ncbi:MAG: hypothetical protein K2M04_07940 [Muribaculaceae bacterium]|nr:hypothetical protein [Muribaculaceae bacterium]
MDRTSTLTSSIHPSSSSPEIARAAADGPKESVLAFLRQFARTYGAVHNPLKGSAPTILPN